METSGKRWTPSYIAAARLKGKLLFTVSDGTKVRYLGKIGSKLQNPYADKSNEELLEKYLEVSNILENDASTYWGRQFRRIEKEILSRMGSK